MILASTLLLAVSIAPWAFGTGEQAEPSYQQTYRIFIHNSPAGTEAFSERIAKNGSLVVDSTHEILVSDGVETKRMAFSTSLTLEKKTYSPVTYSCRYSSGENKDSYEVSVSKGQVTRIITRAGHTSERSLAAQPGMVIVDFNVYYQFTYLYRHYEPKRGGRQTFSNFLPVLAVDAPVSLTRLDDSEAKGSIKGSPFQDFRIEFARMWVGIATFDHAGRLARLRIRDKGLEVVREDILAIQ